MESLFEYTTFFLAIRQFKLVESTPRLSKNAEITETGRTLVPYCPYSTDIPTKLPDRDITGEPINLSLERKSVSIIASSLLPSFLIDEISPFLIAIPSEFRLIDTTV